MLGELILAIVFENSATNSHKYSSRIGIVERRTALAELDGLDWHGRNIMQYEYGPILSSGLGDAV